MKTLALSVAVIALSSAAFAEEVHHYSYQGVKRPVAVRNDNQIPAPTFFVPEERKQKAYSSSLKPQRKWGGGGSTFSGVAFPTFNFSAVNQFAAPAFAAPTFTAPAFATPAFATPAFAQPGYSAPAFSAPAFQAPAFAAPAFQ